MSTPNSDMCELHSYCDQIRRHQQFHDVIIKVEGREFPCHRIILASALEYFRSIFCGNSEEANKKEVQVNGIKADDFELLLTYIYGGSVNFFRQNVYRLLRISNCLNLQRLSDLCENYIISNHKVIPLKTAVNIFVFASKIENAKLVDLLVERLAKNFPIVSRMEHLLYISAIDLRKMLTHGFLVNDITAMLDFVLDWTKYHSDGDDFLANILTEAGLGQELNQWFMKKLKENTRLTSKCDDGNTEKTIAIVEQNTFIDDLLHFDFKQKELPISLYGYCHSASNNLAHFQFKSPDNIQFKQLIPAYINEKVRKSAFVDGAQIMITATYYNAKWFQFIPFIHHSSKADTLWPSHYVEHKSSCHCDYMTLAACNSNIYISCYDEFLVFNCQIGTWSEFLGFGSGLERTRYSNLVSHNNTLYMIGGQRIEEAGINKPFSSSTTLKYFEENGKYFQRYDSRSGKWDQLPKMIYSRCRSASCVYNNVLYVSGSEYLTGGLVEYCDLRYVTWNAFTTSMPKPKHSHTIIGYDDQLWFLGGYSEKAPDLTWYLYNLKEETWSPTFSMTNVCSNPKVDHILDVVVQV